MPSQPRGVSVFGAISSRPSLTIVIEGLSVFVAYGPQREATATAQVPQIGGTFLEFVPLLSADKAVGAFDCYLENLLATKEISLATIGGSCWFLRRFLLATVEIGAGDISTVREF